MGILFGFWLLLAPPQEGSQAELDALKKRWADQRTAPLAERIETVRAIAGLKSEPAANYLHHGIFLHSRSVEIRRAIAEALADNGTPRAFRALAVIVRRSEERRVVRQAALASAAAWANDVGLEVVAPLARNRNPKNDLRDDAVALLGRFPIEETRRHWMKLLGEADVRVRIPALKALSPLKDEKVVAQAIKIYNDPKKPEKLRAAAVEAIRVMNDTRHVTILLQGAVAPGGALEKGLTEELSKVTDAKAVRLIARYAAKSARPQIRVVCMRALPHLKYADVLATLKKALSDPIEEVREAAVEGLPTVGTPEAVAAHRDFAQQGERRAHLAAIAMLGRLDAGDAGDLLMNMAEDRSSAVRVTALLALGMMAPDGVLDLFARQLNHKHWPTRAATIRSLGFVPDKRSVALLLDRMDREEGRLRWDIALALSLLTGKMLGYTSEPWREWWARHRETFVFPKLAGQPDPAEAASTKAYYGVPLLSKRITFCIDASGSMSATTADRPISKLEAARRTLKQTLRSLGEDVMFNIVFFDEIAVPWKSKLQPADPRNVQRALDMARRVKPSGGTNIFGTLGVALADPGVDTIFLLSDGKAHTGRFTDPDRILREIAAINRTRRVVIHTISLGPSRFMKRLAEVTGGKYVER